MESSLLQDTLLLERVLSVALVPGHSGFFLSTAATELAGLSSASIADRLTVIDSVLVERLGLPDTDSLQFLTSAYAAVQTERPSADDRTLRILDYLQELLVSYAGLAVYQPDLFPGEPAEGCDRLLKYLLAPVNSEFINKMLDYWKSEDPPFAQTLLEEALAKNQQAARTSDLLSGGHACMQQFNALCEFNGVPELVMSRKWLESSPHHHLQHAPLSAFLNISACPRDEFLFKHPGSAPPPHKQRDALLHDVQMGLNLKQVPQLQSRYRSEAAMYSAGLLEIAKKLVRTNSQLFLEWVWRAVHFNRQKGQQACLVPQSREKHLSTNGYLFNLLDIFLGLCGPILTNPSRLAKVDVTFLQTSPEFTAETPLCYDAPKNQTSPSEFGTVTHFFFLCAKLIHLAWTGTCSTFTRLGKINMRLRTNPDPRLQNDKRYFGLLAVAFETFVRDPQRCQRIKEYFMTMSKLLTQWLGFAGQVELPEPSALMGSVPEYFVEDMNEFYSMCLGPKSEFLNNFTPEEFLEYMQFSILLVSNPEIIKNPYLRARLGHIACSLIVLKRWYSPVQVIFNHAFVGEHAVRFIIRFYVDAEFTGTHSQFYDKFKYRHVASKALRILWTNEHFREQMKALVHWPSFVRFINMLVNDTTFLLDEGLNKMAEIKQFQIRVNQGHQLTHEEAKAQEQAGNYGSYTLQQANESITLMLIVSNWHPNLFLEDEFRDRVAATLNYTQNLLCGPKALELDYPERFNFRPGKLLANLIMIYLNLGNKTQFLQAIVNDSRSYNSDTMKKAHLIARMQKLLPPEKLRRWEQLIHAVMTLAQESKDLSDLLGDIPEEFICPISCELMKRPVRLPSGYTVDKVTISRILLSDQHDPFTRQPLTIEEVEEDTELKARIEAWVQQRKTDTSS